MPRFRTIRQRSRRAKKGQVAAVATILGLLLVVTFISNYLTQQLPQLETTAELDHILLVENQMSRLQTTILAEANSHLGGLTIPSPITLGSQSVPPFGAPAEGTLAPELGTVRTSASYEISTIVPSPPAWNVGSACLTGGSGQCAANGNLDTWNITNANHTSLNVQVTGGNNSLLYQLNGNNDSLNVTWNGQDLGFAAFVLNGSNDNVIFSKGGSDSNAPLIEFLFFGEFDKFSFSPSGSHSGKGSDRLYVQFVGERLGVCPYGSLSSTDSIGTLSSGGSNLNMTVVWYNSVGLVSGPHAQTYPGGGGANETIFWWNKTGVVACAFTASYPSQYVSSYGAGLVARLYNRYLPITDVAYDQGAVIESQGGGSPIMISPPELTVTTLPAGFGVALTLVNFVGNFSAESGVTTASVLTQVVQVHTFSVTNGQTSTYLSSAVSLNITTAYPGAWLRYIAGLPQIFPYGAQCHASPPLSAPYSCASPPTGTLVTISAPLNAVAFTLTSVTVALTIV